MRIDGNMVLAIADAVGTKGIDGAVGYLSLLDSHEACHVPDSPRTLRCHI
jgi:hypothetical protein